MPDFNALEQALNFDNRFVGQLPGDSSADARPRQVLGAAYSRVTPRRASAPQLVAYSPEMARRLGLDAYHCESEAFAQVFAGNHRLSGMDYYAMCYGGYQFGQWAGQLGDGRAINLGEVKDVAGEHWTLQLKGAGETPYSRHADGLAVLRSSVREFLCSEAMHHLGVPTTRALSLVTTGDSVVRDMFYDGHPESEPGAVVCRAATSFVRFGSFEIFAQRGERELLRQLADFTVEANFPELLPRSGAPDKHTYVSWFAEVVERTAALMAHWMRVGFVHGVMNTDNMSIVGDTIDYGPYGWLEGFDPEWTPNTTDAATRRYSYGAQPNIGLWNLVRLANAIYPLVGEAKPLEQALERYSDLFAKRRSEDMMHKLGLDEFRPSDGELVDDLFALLQQTKTDMTLFFRHLADVDIAPEEASGAHKAHRQPLMPAYYQTPGEAVLAATDQWLERYRARAREALQVCGKGPQWRRQRMNAANPKYVLRNYLAQQAIDKAEQGDHSEVTRLLDVMRRPYDEQPQYASYAQKRPEWARVKPGCSMLSCSS